MLFLPLQTVWSERINGLSIQITQRRNSSGGKSASQWRKFFRCLNWVYRSHSRNVLKYSSGRFQCIWISKRLTYGIHTCDVSRFYVWTLQLVRTSRDTVGKRHNERGRKREGKRWNHNNKNQLIVEYLCCRKLSFEHVYELVTLLTHCRHLRLIVEKPVCFFFFFYFCFFVFSSSHFRCSPNTVRIHVRFVSIFYLIAWMPRNLLLFCLRCCCCCCHCSSSTFFSIAEFGCFLSLIR